MMRDETDAKRKRYVYLIPDDIHHELCNWSRWCWLGPWPHPIPATSCGSLESQYRAPPEWDTLDQRRMPVIRPNAERAQVVQGVWAGLPTGERLVLKAEYPGSETSGRNAGRSVAATRLGLALQQYERLLVSAAQRVGAAFAVRA